MNDVIIQNGKHLTVANITNTFSKLPVGNYVLQFNEMSGFYLETQTPFDIPKNIYGDLSYTERWKIAFEATNKNLGILLSGYKGNGKTLTAQYFCQMMKLPVIFITRAYTGPVFESFISNPLFNNSIIFIDEFEKLYSDDEGNGDALLALMDGVYTTHNIFLLTANDTRIINDKFKNRLGRIRYHKKYSSIEPSVIDATIKDLLKRKEHEKSVRATVDLIPNLSFDILTTLIKEVNLFNQPATDCVRFLNLVRESIYYDISVTNGIDRIECSSRMVMVPEGSVDIYYMNARPKGTKWPEGRLNLQNYALEKIDGGLKFNYDNTYTVMLLRSDSEIFTF